MVGCNKHPGTIPLILHTDGVEVYSNSEYVVWSIGSALCSAHPYDQKFPLVIIPHAAMTTETVKVNVHRTIARVIMWSLEHAASGERPTIGPFGEDLGQRSNFKGPLLGGEWYGVYYGFRADEKARKESHFFTRSYQHGKICMNCMAQRPRKGWQPELSYKHMGRHSVHKMTQASI